MGQQVPEKGWSTLAKELGAAEPSLLFSLRDGFVWASWPGTDAAIRLGRHDMVAGMMYDFLAQDEVARRLGIARQRHRGAER